MSINSFIDVLHDDENKAFMMLENKYQNINETDEKGRTPLMIATIKGYTEIVRAIMKKYKDTSFIKLDNRGNNVMDYAILKDRPEILRLLLKKDTILNDINRKNKKGYTPLNLASKENNYECASILLKIPNINMNIADSKSRTPLYYSIQNRNFELFHDLVKRKKTNVNLLYTREKTPLIMCIEDELENFTDFLLKRPDIIVNPVDREYYSPFIQACINGNISLCNLLLDKKADINYKTSNDGMTPLLSAIEKNQIGILKFLLEKKELEVNTEVGFGNNKKTPLLMLIEKNKPEMLRLLLKRPDLKMEENAIVIAIKLGYYEIIRLLLKRRDVIVTETTYEYVKLSESPIIKNIFKEYDTKRYVVLRQKELPPHIVDRILGYTEMMEDERIMNSLTLALEEQNIKKIIGIIQNPDFVLPKFIDLNNYFSFYRLIFDLVSIPENLQIILSKPKVFKKIISNDILLDIAVDMGNLELDDILLFEPNLPRLLTSLDYKSYEELQMMNLMNSEIFEEILSHPSFDVNEIIDDEKLDIMYFFIVNNIDTILWDGNRININIEILNKLLEIQGDNVDFDRRYGDNNESIIDLARRFNRSPEVIRLLERYNERFQERKSIVNRGARLILDDENIPKDLVNIITDF